MGENVENARMQKCRNTKMGKIRPDQSIVKDKKRKLGKGV